MSQSKLLLLILLFPLLTRAQSVDDLVAYDQKLLDRFYKSTTYIVLDQHAESSFSLKIKEVAEEMWKITPYEVIDRGTFEKYSMDKTKSFLTREYVAGDKDLISLSLYMGGQKQMETKGILIANVKLKHYTAPEEDFLYKLPILIQNIQWKVGLVREKKFAGKEDYDKYLDGRKNMLHERKLYILKEYLSNKIPNVEQLKKYYKQEVDVVGLDILKDAIQTQDSTIAFLSIVAPTKNLGGQTGYYRIFTADKGESLVSYERPVSSVAPVGVTGFDLKNYNK